MKRNELTAKSVGAAMREARLDAGYSIQSLAELSGVNENTIANNELGKYAPGMLNLVRLADTLGLPLDDYVGRRLP